MSLGHKAPLSTFSIDTTATPTVVTQQQSYAAEMWTTARSQTEHGYRANAGYSTVKEADPPQLTPKAGLGKEKDLQLYPSPSDLFWLQY
jgi:hypothetical protein